jgi:hypothetical protein
MSEPQALEGPFTPEQEARIRQIVRQENYAWMARAGKKMDEEWAKDHPPNPKP